MDQTTEQPSGDSEQGLLERLETALSPAEAPQTETVEASQEEAAETPNEQPDAGFVDLQTEDGETYKVPPKLRDGYLRQSDYTKKTQELADLQRQVQLNLSRQKEQEAYEKDTAEDRARLQALKADMQRYRSVDMSTMDTDALLRTRAYLDSLQQQVSDLEGGLKSKEEAVRQRLGHQRNEAIQAAYSYIGKHVKDFTPGSNTERDIATYAQGLGVPAGPFGEIAVMFPGLAVMAAKAAQFDKLQAGKVAVIKQAQKAPPVVQPGATTSTNSAQAQTDKLLRTQLKKSGSLKDAAALFLHRKT